MASNFYNMHGLMHGIDPHDYMAFPAIPMPMPYVVGVPFMWLDSTPQKIARTVTTNGARALCGGYTNMLVPHVPIPLAPPGPGEVAILACVIAASGTKAQLSAHKVTHQGEALAVCVKAMIGLNVNCGDPFDVPTGLVLNLNSVETLPTAGDYAGAIAGYIVDAALGWALGAAGKKLTDEDGLQLLMKWVTRFVPDRLKPYTDLLDPAGKTQELIQKLVDGDENRVAVPFLPPFLSPKV
jgi:hypothetical protein